MIVPIKVPVQLVYFPQARKKIPTNVKAMAAKVAPKNKMDTKTI